MEPPPPPYSQNLAPNLRFKHLSGTRFSSNSDAKPAAENCGRDFYQAELNKLILRTDKCLNRFDDSDSDDEDAILADLKEKWKTVEGNERITDDATLSDILEVDAELLTASYPTDEEILKSLMDNNKGQK
ncbi:hypothetical protein AVEN_180282-1 [Araneus ventricosus]|uniref:Uncharacterized protein n=1 Tax=Araneus ventricosus TaxID=182803 RepID=A0A4Y2QLW9_ARAVE|nr:hypothetical protein AVEN_180282-1 [Araneus ventricosus]